ncbi:MAG: hypothetical protein AB1757_16030 [Acidobacteriota bacterium]
MRFNRLITSWLAIPIVFIGCLSLQAQPLQETEYGPEVKSFLELCRHEEEELEFQIKHGEINRQDYMRSKNRLAIQRQMVLKRIKDTGEDVVPDLHVVTSAEISQLIEGGMKAVKGAKPGTLIASKWLYLGSANRGETYYIFERANELSTVTRPRTVTKNQP